MFTGTVLRTTARLLRGKAELAPLVASVDLASVGDHRYFFDTNTIDTLYLKISIDR